MRWWRGTAAQIALAYAVVSVVWIFGSDTLVSLLPNGWQLAAENVKGTLFVAVTAIALWGLVRARERDLSRESARLENLMDVSPAGVVLTDTELHTVDANQVARELLRTSAPQLAAEPDARGWQVTDFEGNVFTSDMLATTVALREGHHVHVDERVVWPDGSEVFLSVSATPVADEAGRVTSALTVLSDITPLVLAERMRRKEAEQAKLYFDSAEVVLIVAGVDARVQTANRKAFESLAAGGVTEPIGRLVTELFHSQRDAADTLADILAWESSGAPTQPFREEFGLGSDQRTVEGHIVGVRGTDGELTGFLISAEDVTDRDRAERELAESENKFRNFVDFTYDWEYWIDPGRKVLYTSPSCERISGYTAEEITADPTLIERMVHPDDRERFRTHFDESATLDGAGMELRIVTKTGEERWIAHHCRPVVSADGVPLGRRGTNRDITSSKEAEKALSASQTQFGTALQLAHLGMWRFDAEKHCVELDEIAAPLFGHPAVPASVTWEDLIALVHPEDSERVGAALADAIAGEEPFAEEFRVVGPDASLRWLESRASVAPGVDGTSALRGFVWDTTSLGDVRELRIAKEAAEAANASKTAFLASMSHEIRTPMNAILGFTQLMSRDPSLTREQAERLDVINRSGEHLIAIINDVLEMSKIEAGRATIRFSSFEVRPFLVDLRRMFEMRARDKGLDFDLAIADDVPRFVVSDQGKLRQVLINLLGNAVKFTLQGGVSLRVGTRNDDGRLLLTGEVEDTGPGIGAEDVKRLFDFFEQGSSRLGSEEGTGLGLAISREYVRLLGGEVAVRSEEGRGSTFSFWVPVEAAENDSEVSAWEHGKVIAVKGRETPVSVLVADDHADNRELLRQLLEGVGFDVRLASDGDHAVRSYGAERPELVLMDLRMPVMDGHQAIRKIRELDPDACIIAISASAFAEARREARGDGADAFVGKPVRESELFAKIAAVLGVEYEYASEGTSGGIDAESLARSFSALPAEVVSEIRSATVAGDFDRVIAIAGGLEASHRQAGDTLVRAAKEFDTERILRMLPEVAR